jgi:hypothetical protein
MALHVEAEAATRKALAAAHEAGQLVERLGVVADVFEYGEATRNLRAALTALLSARIDL